MSEEETHSDEGLEPILTGFGVLAVVAGLTVTAVLMAGRPKYDRTDLRTIEDLKAAQIAEMEAEPAWVDKEKGTVSLPVSRAAKLVVAEIQRNPSLATQGEPLPAATEAGAAGAGAGGAPGAAGATSAAGGEAAPEAGQAGAATTEDAHDMAAAAGAPAMQPAEDDELAAPKANAKMKKPAAAKAPAAKAPAAKAPAAKAGVKAPAPAKPKPPPPPKR